MNWCKCHLMISPLLHKLPHTRTGSRQGLTKSMLLLSGRLVVVGNQVVMVNCSDSEPLSCSRQVGPTQEVFKSGWDVSSAATVFVLKIIWSVRCWQAEQTFINSKAAASLHSSLIFAHFRSNHFGITCSYEFFESTTCSLNLS